MSASDHGSPAPAKSNRWVVLHGGALGDVVLTLQLALRLPGTAAPACLHVISRCDPGDLSACQPAITRQSAESFGLHWLYTAHDNPPPAQLRDLIGGAHILSALADEQSTVHRRLQSLAPARLLSFDPRPRTGLSRHITAQWQTDLERQGLLVPKCIHQHPAHRSLGVPPAMKARGERVLHEAGAVAGCVLIHPGSGGREKCWPLPNFVEVARRLTHERNPVCFLLGAVELERWSDADLRALQHEFPILRLPQPDDLAAALSSARALLANDSGPAHLAALLGTRTIVLFGPTAPTVWRPLGRDVHVIAGTPQTHPADWNIQREKLVSLLLARP